MRVVFVGNCQAAAMHEIYRRTLPIEMRQDAHYVAIYQNLSDSDRETFEQADRIVWQLTQFDQKVTDIPTAAPKLFFPMVTAPFLWPFSGEAHPKNVTPVFKPEGPYPAEIGDRFLNDLVRKDVSDVEGAKRWFDTNFAATRGVQRLLEFTLEQQRTRDRACGRYHVASLIERLLPVTPLFRTRGHLTRPLLRHIAEVLFSAMELDDTAMQTVRETNYEDLVPDQDAPIHPTIAQEFGMYFVRSDTLYQFHEEGLFTAREYIERYMRCDWDPILAEGLWLLHRHQDPIAAYPLLVSARTTSPRSAAGTASFFHAKAAYEAKFGPQAHRPATAITTQSKCRPTWSELTMTTKSLAITFGANGDANQYLNQGWSHPESGFTWTISKSAEIQIPKPPEGDYVLVADKDAHRPPGIAAQNVTVMLGDVVLGTYPVTTRRKYSIEVQAEAIRSATDPMKLRFEIPDAARPIDHGTSNDARMLGLAFRSLTLTEKGVEPESDRTSTDGLAAQDTPSAPAPAVNFKSPENTSLMRQFCSLGRNCEFGDAQRKCGAEPLDLLRWASTPPHILLNLLNAGFADMADGLSVFPGYNGEHMVQSDRYGFIWHAHAPELTAEQVLQRERSRIPRMAEMLLDYVNEGERIFVRHNALEDEDSRAIAKALRALGSNTLLLHVREATADHPQGTVVVEDDSLVTGYIGQFADPENIPGTTRADLWLELCAAAANAAKDIPGRCARRGERLALDGDFVGADAQLRRAIELSPTDASFHVRLGSLLAGQGQVSQAVDVARAAQAIAPDNQEVQELLESLLDHQLEMAERATQAQMTEQAAEDLPAALEEAATADVVHTYQTEAMHAPQNDYEPPAPAPAPNEAGSSPELTESAIRVHPMVASLEKGWSKLMHSARQRLSRNNTTPH